MMHGGDEDEALKEHLANDSNLAAAIAIVAASPLAFATATVAITRILIVVTAVGESWGGGQLINK